MKSLFLIILLLAVMFRLYAPDHRVLFISIADKIQPYEHIWDIICQYESKNDSCAFCIDINGLPSVGIAQVQKSRVDDYNRQSGDNLTLIDMYRPGNAKKVFMWYASKIGDTDKIIRSWNGSGPMADIYLHNIKKLL